jgi:hypothetical protein
MLKENLVLQDTIMSVLWLLPYESRQLIFKTLSPRAYKRFQAMRVAEGGGRSLKSFDEQRSIFVHITKCAGVSISKSLFGNLGGAHLRIPHYQLIFSKREFEDYFKFTFVRNPWDRLVSAFHFLIKGGANKVDRQWADGNLSRFDDFHSFVTQWVNRKSINTWKHFVPQYKFVCEPGRHTPRVDFIGYFEHLEDDFAYIRNRLGHTSDLQHLNKTGGERKGYQEYYTQATRDLVADVYREDIEIFGYEFEQSLSAKRIPYNISDNSSLVR